MTTHSGPVRRIQAGSVRLAFRAWNAAPSPGVRPAPGAPAAGAVVLLHTLGDDSSDWERVAAALAPSWRVYAPDLRGHGASDWSGPYTAERLTADLEAFLDALGLRRVALVGHGTGTAPAYLFAARRPDRVSRLVLEEPAPPFPGPPVSLPPVSRERPEGPPAFAGDAIALGGEFTDPPPAWRDALGDIKVPTLLVAGGPGSHLAQDRLAEMAALIGDCELATIEAGHLIHAARPAEFAETVAAFLAKGPLSHGRPGIRQGGPFGNGVDVALNPVLSGGSGNHLLREGGGSGSDPLRQGQPSGKRSGSMRSKVTAACHDATS